MRQDSYAQPVRKSQKIVRQVANGDGCIAIAITEPNAGTTHVIIFTQSAGGRHGDLSDFVLPIDTPGLKRETLEAHGLTGNSYGGLQFGSLFVCDDLLIGEDGKGTDNFDEHFLYWRLMQADLPCQKRIALLRPFLDDRTPRVQLA